MFSDPLKLIPLVICLGAVVGLCLGRLNPTEATTMIGLAGAAHATISAINNVNPPKDGGK